MIDIEFVEKLRTAVGDTQVRLDPDDLQRYGTDWTKRGPVRACALALPQTPEQVQAIVRLCAQYAVAIVPSGGRTGLAAGAAAQNGELILSLEQLNRLDSVDLTGLTVRVQAGVTNQALQDHCAIYGLCWPIDLASKGTATIGGNLATNAGGLKVIARGHARQWVLGLQVVTAQGDLLDLGGALEKNNTGLDLRQLFIGSEGTLGIITAATLKLTHPTHKSHVMLLGLQDLPQALDLLAQLRQQAVVLQAFECFSAFCLQQVIRNRQVAQPLATLVPYYALIELTIAPDFALDAWLAQRLQLGEILDGTLAQDARQARALWQYRESITESLTQGGPPHKNDVALPIAQLPAFVDALHNEWLAKRPDWQVALFGHLGDGNLHINVLRPQGSDPLEFAQKMADADLEMFAIVQRFKGSISAEHGVGLVKKPYLHFSRTPEELAMMRAVKLALDPHNLLNPGKIFDL